MAEKEVAWTAEAGLAGAIPYGRIARTSTRRWRERGHALIETIIDEVGEVELEQRLLDSEEVDVAFGLAVEAAAASGLQSKRALLARVVAQAVLDDSLIDSSSLLVSTLAQIDAAHVRCLEAVARAEQAAIDSGDMGTIAYGAEKPITAGVNEAVKPYPSPLLQSLISLGLLDGHVNWDGHRLISGLTTYGDNLLGWLRETG